MTVPRFNLWLSGIGSSGDGSAGSQGDDTRRGVRGGAQLRARVDDVPVTVSDDDRCLLEQLRAGNIAVFESLYIEMGPRLWSFAYRYLHSRTDAEDVVQDVFHALWNGRERLRIHSSVSAYLYGAVRFRALRTRHDRVRDDVAGQMALSSETLPSGVFDSTTRAESSSFDEAVHRILDRLRPPARDVLYLRWTQGMSYDDIAAALGISAASARQQVHRILQRFGPAFRNLL